MQPATRQKDVTPMYKKKELPMIEEMSDIKWSATYLAGKDVFKFTKITIEKIFSIHTKRRNL
jgi:hypothetical protein